MTDIEIRDQHGFTQAMRRTLARLALQRAVRDLAAQGRTLTYTEEADGFTLFLDGENFDRVTYGELAAAEATIDRREGLSWNAWW